MNGPQIRERREALGLTQEHLATRLGVSRNTVARWERDEIAAPPYLELALTSLAKRGRGEPFDKYLRRVITESAFTVREIANRAGLSEGYIHELVTGNKDPANMTLSSVRKLASGLQRPELEVVEAAGITGAQTLQRSSAARFAEMAKEYEHLTQAQRSVIDPALTGIEQMIKAARKSKG